MLKRTVVVVLGLAVVLTAAMVTYGFVELRASDHIGRVSAEVAALAWVYGVGLIALARRARRSSARVGLLLLAGAPWVIAELVRALSPFDSIAAQHARVDAIVVGSMATSVVMAGLAIVWSARTTRAARRRWWRAAWVVPPLVAIGFGVAHLADHWIFGAFQEIPWLVPAAALVAAGLALPRARATHQAQMLLAAAASVSAIAVSQCSALTADAVFVDPSEFGFFLYCMPQVIEGSEILAGLRRAPHWAAWSVALFAVGVAWIEARGWRRATSVAALLAVCLLPIAAHDVGHTHTMTTLRERVSAPRWPDGFEPIEIAPEQGWRYPHNDYSDGDGLAHGQLLHRDGTRRCLDEPCEGYERLVVERGTRWSTVSRALLLTEARGIVGAAPRLPDEVRLLPDAELFYRRSSRVVDFDVETYVSSDDWWRSRGRDERLYVHDWSCTGPRAGDAPLDAADHDSIYVVVPPDCLADDVAGAIARARAASVDVVVVQDDPVGTHDLVTVAPEAVGDACLVAARPTSVFTAEQHRAACERGELARCAQWGTEEGAARACEGGCALGCAVLGDVLRRSDASRGDGAPEDYFRQACDGGAELGCFLLGEEMYWGGNEPFGEWMAFNAERAIPMLARSCERGWTDACLYLADAADNGLPVPPQAVEVCCQ